MTLIIFILLAYGATNIVHQGAIFYWLRNWIESKAVTGSKIFHFFHKMITCPMCFGFWVGLFIGLIFNYPFVWWNVLCNGIFYSGTTWLLYCVAQFLGQGYDPSRTLNIQFANSINIERKKSDKEN